MFQAVLSSEKLPSLEGILVGTGKALPYSKCRCICLYLDFTMVNSSECDNNVPGVKIVILSLAEFCDSRIVISCKLHNIGAQMSVFVFIMRGLCEHVVCVACVCICVLNIGI